MKCLVLISLALNTLLLKINAQDNLIQLNAQQLNESELKSVGLESALLTVPFQKDSFVQKIKKSDDNGFLIDLNIQNNMSSEQLDEKLKSSSKTIENVETSLRVNLITGEDYGANHKYLDSDERLKKSTQNPKTSISSGDTSQLMIGTVKSNSHVLNETVTDTVGARPPETAVDKKLPSNEAINLLNSFLRNTTLAKSRNITIFASEEVNQEQSGWSLNEYPPQNETQIDVNNSPIVLEHFKDSIIEGSNLRKEKIVPSDTKHLFSNNNNERFPKNVNRSSISDRDSIRNKNNQGKWHGSQNKNKTKSRNSNKNPVSKHEIESKSSNISSSGTNISHVQQEKRMVHNAFGYQDTDIVKYQHNNFYNVEPYHQYAQGYPHGGPSSLDNGKPLFQPYYGGGIPLPVTNIEQWPGHATSSQYFEHKNKYGPVTFRHEINHGAPQQHTKHTHEEETITVTKEIPVPYTVKIEKQVPYPVYVKVPYNKPYPVYVPKPYRVIHEVLQPYNVHIKVPKPYEVIKHIPKPVKVPVDRPYPVEVPKPYHVTVEKKVPVTVEKPVPYPVHVPVDRPYPVHVPVTKHVPYTVEKKVPVHVQVPVDKPYPVYIPKPYAVHVNKPVPHIVEKPVPYPVKVPVKYPVKVPVPFEVIKEVPVYEHKQQHYSHPF